MTETRRRQAAQFFRDLLDRGVHRKEAMRRTLAEFGCDRASIYRWCARFKVSTR